MNGAAGSYARPMARALISRGLCGSPSQASTIAADVGTHRFGSWRKWRNGIQALWPGLRGGGEKRAWPTTPIRLPAGAGWVCA